MEFVSYVYQNDEEDDIKPYLRLYGKVLSECEVGVFYLSNQK